MKNNSVYANDIATQQSEAWVREMLEPDQLSSAKHTVGLLKLTGKMVVLLWGLRVYVVLMVVMIGLQIWNTLHAGS
jgi:hypothetical protein